MKIEDEFQIFFRQLPEIEERVRGMLWWDTGDSRLLLWISALITFAIFVNVIAIPVGWVAGRVAERIFGNGPIGPR